MTVLRTLLTGWPVALEMASSVPASPEVVWDLITDWEHLDDWMLEAEDFVITSPQRRGLGVEGEATITIAGFRTRDRIRVVGWDEPRYLAIEHRGWVGGVGEMHLTPSGRGTTFFTWREELRPPLGGLGGLGLTILKPVMHRIFRRDVRILVSLARARATR
ncbi:MAG: SRPBCC family protein [Actinomycetota bacterium]|nr:SRPBCC family protein [Actinomycetota bacterium]